MSAEKMKDEKLIDEFDACVSGIASGLGFSSDCETFVELRAEILRRMAHFDPSGGER